MVLTKNWFRGNTEEEESWVEKKEENVLLSGEIKKQGEKDNEINKRRI